MSANPGVITQRNASLGQKVNLSSELFEIIDVDNVWLEADIFEKDLQRIKYGQIVKVRVAAFEGEVFTGNIFHVGNTLDPETRTIKVLVEIDNASHKLKPGMFATTHIVVGMKSDALVIPRIAVLEDEHLNIVFVKEEAGYHRHVVTLGIVADDMVEVVTGLHQGDRVVTQGNYQLKSKLRMSGVDPHAGHVH